MQLTSLSGLFAAPPSTSPLILFLSHRSRHLLQVSCQLYSHFTVFSLQSGFRNLDSRMRVHQCVCKSGCARAQTGGLFCTTSFLEQVFIRNFKNVSETCQVVSAKQLQLLSTYSNFEIQPRTCAERRGCRKMGKCGDVSRVQMKTCGGSLGTGRLFTA